jgi:hypothetical protein
MVMIRPLFTIKHTIDHIPYNIQHDILHIVQNDIAYIVRQTINIVHHRIKQSTTQMQAHISVFDHGKG